MRPSESLRASDADRDAVTERLREAAAEGRLEPEELEERVGAALRARTYGELRPLVADPPHDGDAPWLRPGWRTTARARSALLGAGLVAAVTVAVALVALAVVLVLVAAAVAATWWIACVLFWLVVRRSRRRLASGSAWRQRARAGQVRRARQTGIL
jgi:Domain of unknown function (DUF1707)